MMGEGQPKMGAAFMAGSLFTGMSSTQLKAALKKLQKELDETIPALRARSQSNWRSFKETRNKGDEFDAKRLERQADRSETRNLREQEEIKELLKQGELPLGGTGRLGKNPLAKEIDPDNPYIRIIPANEKGKNITLDLTPSHPYDSQSEGIKKGLLTNRDYDQLIRDEVTASYFSKTGKKAATETPEQAKGIGGLFQRYKDDLADPEKAKHIGPYEDWVRERQQSAVRGAQEKIEKFSLEDVDDLSAEEMRQLIKILSGNEF
jgi:hypothetical protein